MIRAIRIGEDAVGVPPSLLECRDVAELIRRALEPTGRDVAFEGALVLRYGDRERWRNGRRRAIVHPP